MNLLDPKDVINFYTVTKEPDWHVDMPEMIIRIKDYIQNNPIYFGSDMTFVDGVLVISIVGYVEEQDKFLEIVGASLKELHCNIERYEVQKGE